MDMTDADVGSMTVIAVRCSLLYLAATAALLTLVIAAQIATWKEMNRRSIRLVTDPDRRLFFPWQYFSSEKFVNPETGRASVGMSMEQEAALGFQSYRQVLAQSRTINSGPQFEMVRRSRPDSRRLPAKRERAFEWEVSLIRDGR